MERKIKYISVILDVNGISESIKEFNYNPTQSGYIIEAQSNFGGKTTRIKRSDILKIGSLVREGLYDVIQFYTWYFEADEQKAISAVYKKVNDTARSQYKTASSLLTHLQNNNQERI